MLFQLSGFRNQFYVKQFFSIHNRNGSYFKEYSDDRYHEIRIGFVGK